MKQLYLDGKMFAGTEEEFLAVENFKYKEWKLNGRIHRENGPAHIRSNGYQVWYQNGKCHRIDGPALFWPDGERHWYQNGVRHREDGPAVIYSNDSRRWYQNDENITHWADWFSLVRWIYIGKQK